MTAGAIITIACWGLFVIWLAHATVAELMHRFDRERRYTVLTGGRRRRTRRHRR
jgi:hypothetical protein